MNVAVPMWNLVVHINGFQQYLRYHLHSWRQLGLIFTCYSLDGSDNDVAPKRPNIGCSEFL